MSKILVTYVSKTGSTKEVAERIKKILSNNHQVDIRPMSENISLEHYDGIIIGGPVNGMNWHVDAKAYVKTHEKLLKNKKVALYTLGIMAKQGRKFFMKKVNHVLDVSEKNINAMSTAVFGGVAEGGYSTFMSFMFGISKTSDADQRDWHKIENWAKELSNKF
jgi:menaquinone-dependent protoporphyrinogen IX oxidase